MSGAKKGNCAHLWLESWELYLLAAAQPLTLSDAEKII